MGAHNKNDGKSETNNVPSVGRTTIPMLCYNCNQHGHFSYNCPHYDRLRQNQDSGSNVVGIVHMGIQPTQSNKYLKVINKQWVILNT